VTESAIRVLVVDDDFRVARIHASYVSKVDGFAVVGQARTAAQARAAIAELTPDLVLLDLYLPDGHGLDLVRSLAGTVAHRPGFLVISAARDVANIEQAMRLGAVHYLVKPFGFSQLRDRLVAYRNMRDRLDRLGGVDGATQDEVDALYATLRPAESVESALPKKHTAPTMALVRRTVERAETDLSATEVADRAGISRATAQRYLSYLAKRGLVELRLRYGGPGRPEQRYRAAGEPPRK
jgi:response regulator of citrate/malate metabolism